MDAKTEARTMSYMVLSSLTHVGLAIAVITMNVATNKTLETTKIEIIDSSQGVDLPPPVASPAPAAPAVETAQKSVAPLTTQQSVAPPQPIAKSMAKTPTAKQAEAVVAPPVVVTQSAPTTQSAPAAEETPLSEELDVPAVITQQDDLNASEVENDFDQIDEQQNQKVLLASREIADQTQQDLSSTEKLAALAAIENQKQSEALAAENAAKREQERQAIAAARAAEEARQQALVAAAAAASAQNQEQSGSGTGEIAGNGKGNQGSESGVRGIEQLKQMPGNQRPLYDSDDRLKGRQGEVSFLAWVSREGGLTQFKLIKSSGHRELDGKTLKALKAWKFQPGQEGWVEIPFRWDLKGGAQPVGPILRVKRS